MSSFSTTKTLQYIKYKIVNMEENGNYILIGILINLLMIFDIYIIINNIPNVDKFFPWLGTICTIAWDIIIFSKFYYGKK